MCQEKVNEHVKNIDELMYRQLKFILGQFDQSICDKTKTQELILTTHEPIYTHEPDADDPRAIIYYVQEVIICPNGTKEVSEKREMRKKQMIKTIIFL